MVGFFHATTTYREANESCYEIAKIQHKADIVTSWLFDTKSIEMEGVGNPTSFSVLQMKIKTTDSYHAVEYPLVFHRNLQ